MHTTRDKILAAVAGASLLIYILACAGASFSPDDAKVLYPSNDPVTGQQALAVYDRHTRKSHLLFTVPAEKFALISSAWSHDGTRAAAIWTGDEKRIDIASIPIGTSQPIRLFSLELPDADDDLGMPFAYWPACVAGSWLLVSNGKAIHRFGLEDGSESSVDVDGNPILFGTNNLVYYLRGLDQGMLRKPQHVEFGAIDVHSLHLSPRFTMPWSDTYGMFALNRDGTQLAVAIGPQGDTDNQIIRIAIFQNGQLRRNIPLGTEVRALGLFLDFFWSGDSRKLYFDYTKPLAHNHFEYGVAELRIQDGALRSLPLLTTNGLARDEGWGLVTALSHDGKTLAAVSTYIQTPSEKLASGDPQRLDPKDLALFLIDVSSPGWEMTKVPIAPLPLPPPPATAQPAAQPAPGVTAK